MLVAVTWLEYLVPPVYSGILDRLNNRGICIGHSYLSMRTHVSDEVGVAVVAVLPPPLFLFSSPTRLATDRLRVGKSHLQL